MTERAELSPRGAEVLRILVWIAVGTFAVATIAHFVDLTLLGRAVLLLDAESQESIAAWASSTVLALAAAAAGLLAITRRPFELSLVVLAAALALLSADDDIGLLDQVLRHRLPDGPNPDLVIWLVSFGPLMGLSVVLLARLSRRIPRDASRTIVWGLVVLVAAVAGEFLVSLVQIPAFGPHMPLYELEAGLEEGFELFGVALLAAALFAILVDELVTVRPT